MPAVLRLYEDIFSDGAALTLPALPRMMFVVHGTVTIADRGLSDGEAWHGEGAVTVARRKIRRQHLALGAGQRGGRGCGRRHRHILARKTRRAPGNAARGRAPAARRQRRVSARRLRLSASSSGAGHPLPARGRHPHRHPWPLHLVWAGRRLVRERARAGVRAGRGRSAEPLHPGHDPAARADREELAAIRQRRRQVEAAGAAVSDFRRHADRAPGRNVGARLTAAADCAIAVLETGRNRRRSSRASGRARWRAPLDARP